MSKVRVLVLAGGESDEHEISILSATSLLEAVVGSDIEATVRVITRDGRWLSGLQSEKALSDGKATGGGELTLHGAQITEEFDVVFPLLHGPRGEDGTVQGMLELAGLPYVGSGVLASAMCMDKVASKAVLATHGFPQVDYRLVTDHQYRADPDAAIESCREIPQPWFTKPANLGSSVGISRTTSTAELRAGIELALRYDRRVIVEQGIENARELETSVLGNDAPQASGVGEITYASEFYDYKTKYTPGHATLHIPAQIPVGVSERIRELAVTAFVALDCAGFARVDFFYQEKTGALFLNELNTIPGFTPFSMYTKLWEHKGLSYGDLVARLVELALERHRQTRR